MPGAAKPCGSTASMPSCSTARRCGRSFPSSISTMRVSRFAAGCCSRAAARCATMLSPGAMPARLTAEAATSSRIAPRPASPTRGAARAGLRLPIESHSVQAFVTEGVKPVIDVVMTFGAGHFYVSQSDKGGLVFGGDIEGYNSSAQPGNLPVIEDVCEGGMALMPMIGRLRILRSWGGLLDMTMDGSPIIDLTPIDGLYLNAGWCYGGFKATPAPRLCLPPSLA